MLRNVKIGLFISGGIAAYKMAELSRLLIKEGAEVRVAMTEAAREFITPLTLQTLTKHKVLVDTFDEDDAEVVQHIHLADWMDICVVAPATANILAKGAQGIGDDIVSTLLLATHCPLLYVPAMNTNMWKNPAVQANVARLRSFGYEVMEPAYGFLAEGYEGQGRLPELQAIVSRLKKHYIQSQKGCPLKGQHVIVTAGGTVERIDPVRHITNDSSGKMGQAMAQAAAYLGASVTLITTRPQNISDEKIHVRAVESASEMFEAINEEFAEADYLVMAAAVSDYRPAETAKQKIKKQNQPNGHTLHLVENPDILAYFGHHKDKQILLGFAAETENLLQHAQSKLERKGAAWIIANDVSRSEIGFNSSDNEVTLLSQTGQKIHLPRAPKEDLALQIWEEILAAQKEDER